MSFRMTNADSKGQFPVPHAHDSVCEKPKSLWQSVNHPVWCRLSDAWTKKRKELTNIFLLNVRCMPVHQAPETVVHRPYEILPFYSGAFFLLKIDHQQDNQVMFLKLWHAKGCNSKILGPEGIAHMSQSTGDCSCPWKPNPRSLLLSAWGEPDLRLDITVR